MHLHKILSLLAILFVLTSHNIHAQRVLFSNHIDKEGNPSGIYEKFLLKKNGGYINVIYASDAAIKCDSVYFEMYYNGRYVKTYDMKIQPKYTSFYMRLFFPLPGVYTLYAINCRKEELAFSHVDVQVSK